MDPLTRQDVVYKISCQDCEASYIGQTKRQLKTRINEHISDINKKSGSPSVTSNHRLEFGHEFKWNDTKILDLEPSYHKRLISEMVHIKKQHKSLNKQSDTDLLLNTYLPISFPLLISFPRFSFFLTHTSSFVALPPIQHTFPLFQGFGYSSC